MSGNAAEPHSANGVDGLESGVSGVSGVGERRGRTVIADRVFEKIAAQAASEVAAAQGRSGGILGIGSESDPHARPKVDVDFATDSVDLDVAVGIAYPGSIRAAAQQIRDQVTHAVQSLTGVAVHRVDIDVTFLSSTTDLADYGSAASDRGRPHRRSGGLR